MERGCGMSSSPSKIHVYGDVLDYLLAAPRHQDLGYNVNAGCHAEFSSDQRTDDGNPFILSLDDYCTLFRPCAAGCPASFT